MDNSVPAPIDIFEKLGILLTRYFIIFLGNIYLEKTL